MFLQQSLLLSLNKDIERKQLKKRKIEVLKTDIYRFPSFNPLASFKNCCYITNDDNEDSILNLSNGYVTGTYNIPFLGAIDDNANNSTDYLFNLIFHLLDIISFKNNFLRIQANFNTSNTEKELARLDPSYVNIINMDPSMFFYIKIDENSDNRFFRTLLESIGGVYCKSSKESYYLFLKSSPIFNQYKTFDIFDFILNKQIVNFTSISILYNNFYINIEDNLHIASKEFFDEIIFVSCNTFIHLENPLYKCSIKIQDNAMIRALSVFTKHGAQLKSLSLDDNETNTFILDFDYLNSDHFNQLIEENNLICSVINK